MRPLYKAIRSHEQVLVRPFRDKEAALRPYLRHQQWQAIWKSQSTPVEAILSELHGRAVDEAASMPVITAAQLQTRLHCLPEKAPGVGGWNNRMLKQLPPDAIEPLAQFLNHMEATGKAPGQWRVVKFAMLAKNVSIERPIGLCDVVYKAWLQVRYSLVQAWMKQYELRAPWDAAKPGVTCLTVSIARIFRSELAVATGRHRATVYLDLTTFYETLAHSRLIASAQELAFPASLLNIAIQIYRGARIIDAEGSMSPVTFTSCGVIAGCPVAPALSKLALYRPCKAVVDTGLSAGLDTWIDDVSIDAEDADAQRVAQKIVALYRTISEELGNAELLISTSKSAFVCTDKRTQHRLKQLLRPGEPPVLHLVKDLGVDSAGARRRRVATSNARITKAAGRSGKLTRLKVTNPKKRALVAATGVETAATFGHQGQGISPKRMKVLRAIAGGHFGKLSFGSLDLVFDLSHVGSGDPFHKIVLEHWAMLQECVVRNLPAASLVRRTWAVSWAKISRSPQRWTVAAGPIGAMQCYLKDLGFDAPTMDVWKRPDGDIVLNWGSPNSGKEVSSLLQKALLKDRWERIALQESADGTQDGIDWTVPRKLLKESAKKPLVQSGLRMLFQGAIRRANHGGEAFCHRCGMANTLQHVLHDCIRWAEVDIGPDPAWKELFPAAPECFGVRGLVPKQSTVHPALTPSQMAVRKEGVFTGEFLPVGPIYYGTDASGGPRGLDPRLRVVSWAVVAIRLRFGEPSASGSLKYSVVGKMTGTLQIGATVNDGESVALDQLARWATGQIQVAADSKIAIRRCRVPDIESKQPAIWTAPQERRDLLQVSWTKGHLSLDQHSQRFGSNMAWTWAANLEADRECSSRSLEAFSADAAVRTDSIDAAARAKCRWLGGRCAYILAHDPIPKVKDLKFEPVPVANKSVKIQGPNKRQQLLAASAAEHPLTGHKWVITTNAKNLCIKCETCTLYAQQVDPGPVIDFVLSHPCRGRPAFPGQDSNIDASHSIVNLGHLWSCSRCKASYSVRVPAKGRLAKKCSGGSAKRAQPVAKPTETAAKGLAALFSGLKLSSASAGIVNPRPSQGPAVAPQARVPQPKAPGPSGFAALFSVGRSLANAPVSFLPGDDLGSVTGPKDPPVASAVATELGTPSARGPQPPFSSLEAVVQALPKAIPNHGSGSVFRGFPHPACPSQS